MRRKKTVLLLIYGLAALTVPPGTTLGDSPGFVIQVDDLQNWDATYDHSEALKLRTDPDEDRDSSLVESDGASGEYLVYQASGYLRSFAVYAYGAEGGTSNALRFYLSSDGKSYRSVEPDIHVDEGNPAAVTYESREFPSGTKYLKIVFAGTGAGTPTSIGKVILNGPGSVGASKPSGPVLYGSMVMLNRASEGDTVYYTTDGSDPRDSLTRKHYSDPIPILEKTVLKSTAVNHSGKDQAAASRVSTYTFDPYPVTAPAPGITDPLDDFKTAASKANLYLAKDNPSYYDNDGSRAVRSTTAQGMLLYRSDTDMTSFTVRSFYYSGQPFEKLRFFASSDGKTYEEVDADSYASGYAQSNWQPYAYESSDLPAHTRYLKIDLIGEAKSWTPQVSDVSIDRTTASVKLAESQDGDGYKATLSSATAGSRIYYRLNKGDDFLPYSGPIELQGYNQLETYAVKDGLVPSPIRSYSVNAGGAVQLDRFGQLESANFAGKVTSEAQLKADAQADATYYGSLKAPEDRDAYGGLAGSAEKYGLKATGYFAVQQLNGRPVMTTPDGNLYFNLGVNGVTPQETYTMVAGREEQFESIPSYASAYKAAYLGKDNFSYYLANKYIKTGSVPTEHDIYTEAIGRLQKWGFNGIGAYSPEKYGEEGKFPYVRMLPLDGMSWAKIDGLSLFDIYAPDAEAKLDKAIAAAVAPHKDDPMLVGYFIGNEYDFHRFYTEVPKLKASKAALKAKLVATLQAKYGTIAAFNAAWKTNFKSFSDLNEAELTLNASPAWRDMESFFSDYLNQFFGTVSKLYRKYDPNHLLLGDRWITTTFHNEKVRQTLSEVEGKYMDVISINYYTYKIETDLLNEVNELSGGKPILMSEFGYGTSEQGLQPLMLNSAVNQFQRGMRYRNFVEGVASLPYVVGADLFNYVDQAGLGRYWQGEWGEHYNSGLVNVADRPYKDYLSGIMATNDDIYKVVLGQRTKFYYDFSQK
ncbi:chitobiase/beta-hexosaminidase C-terminal domain-containing protein [Cohnella zeiphila]|uniref:chitobiase/beta-hexosaminidase C-terminal domain-containing protein n=1 Tax=Cohnella zeiphila TaxID=2761120 RepID=UPI003080D798